MDLCWVAGLSQPPPPPPTSFFTSWSLLFSFFSFFFFFFFLTKPKSHFDLVGFIKSCCHKLSPIVISWSAAVVCSSVGYSGEECCIQHGRHAAAIIPRNIHCPPSSVRLLISSFTFIMCVHQYSLSVPGYHPCLRIFKLNEEEEEEEEAWQWLNRPLDKLVAPSSSSSSIVPIRRQLQLQLQLQLIA